jgi:iron complex outermembrane receptor protein
MITWPDVRRHSGSLLMADDFKINKHSSLKFSGKLEYVSSKVFSEFGLRQLEAIGKDGSEPSNYLLINSDVLYTLKHKEKWTFFSQIGYAERQPTVSEGFGYYLFNSMDGFDYVGSPDLNKETALKLSLGAKWTKQKTNIETKLYHYQFQDYIIGIIDPSLDGMTIGSNGVKVYENIPSASISGFELNITSTLFKTLQFQNTTQFSYGLDHNQNPLQMIPPLRNTTKLSYSKNKFEYRCEVVLAAMQNNPRLVAGESATPSYGLVNLHAQRPFTLFNQEWNASLRINNLFDSYYWDHMDYNSVPRPGRSVVMRLGMKF